RQVLMAADLHATLEQRYEEARLAAASSIPDIRVLEEAVEPTWPSSNQALSVIMMGLIAGLGLSVGAILLLDRYDPRVRYPHQVAEEMGLTVLGVLPLVGRTGSKAATEAASQAAEARREIRMNVAFAHGAAGPVIVTITSPASADGKSF